MVITYLFGYFIGVIVGWFMKEVYKILTGEWKIIIRDKKEK